MTETTEQRAEQRGAERVLKELAKRCKVMAEWHDLQEKVSCAEGDAWEAVDHDWQAKWWREADGLFVELLKWERWEHWPSGVPDVLKRDSNATDALGDGPGGPLDG